MTQQGWGHDDAGRRPTGPSPEWSGGTPWSNSYPTPQPGPWGAPGPQWTGGPPPSRKGNTALIIPLVVTAVLIIAGVAAIVVTSSNKSNQVTDHPSSAATPSTAGAPTTRIVPAQVLPRVARGHRDLLIATMVCDHNPGHGTVSLADIVASNIDSLH